MLFTKYLRDGVRSGAIRTSVRVWLSPRVRAGRRYQFEEGHIEIDSIEPIALEEITPALAAECGFGGVSDLLKVAKHGRGENVYLVRFHYIAPVADVPGSRTTGSRSEGAKREGSHRRPR